LKVSSFKFNSSLKNTLFASVAGTETLSILRILSTSKDTLYIVLFVQLLTISSGVTSVKSKLRFAVTRPAPTTLQFVPSSAVDIA